MAAVPPTTAHPVVVTGALSRASTAGGKAPPCPTFLARRLQVQLRRGREMVGAPITDNSRGRDPADDPIYHQIPFNSPRQARSDSPKLLLHQLPDRAAGFPLPCISFMTLPDEEAEQLDLAGAGNCCSTSAELRASTCLDGGEGRALVADLAQPLGLGDGAQVGAGLDHLEVRNTSLAAELDSSPESTMLEQLRPASPVAWRFCSASGQCRPPRSALLDLVGHPLGELAGVSGRRQRPPVEEIAPAGARRSSDLPGLGGAYPGLDVAARPAPAGSSGSCGGGALLTRGRSSRPRSTRSGGRSGSGK